MSTTTAPIHVEKVQQSRVDSVDWNNLPFGKIFSDHMFVSDYKAGEWTNDRIIPFGHFTIHPASMVLHYGQAIFEGDRKSTRLNSSHFTQSRMPSSA